MYDDDDVTYVYEVARNSDELEALQGRAVDVTYVYDDVTQVYDVCMMMMM